ncbi:MAG TPA: hypothetical protein RMH85_13200 [Polyangiaceae bacterium LLY-WYZ-15_(1-7)]|nr:hypothetical protein [Myxococcales bacterium]MAT25722.1 hypothetical protein [Sandaracinus sp.]HJK93983.1 hypothetical protein [Polyangiaceae bacterium LLY-WYZ-15_(1-7)]MBJ71677.1 hypothetical protein [Sandaracinus sp.]HJK99796.1 hypothetical protein [Polyangiaceae bacterium LLY-WYZ-15_(1-7)]
MENDRGTPPSPRCFCEMASYLGCMDCTATYYARGRHRPGAQAWYLAALVLALGENVVAGGERRL